MQCVQMYMYNISLTDATSCDTKVKQRIENIPPVPQNMRMHDQRMTLRIWISLVVVQPVHSTKDM